MMCITLFTCQIIVRHGEGGTSELFDRLRLRAIIDHARPSISPVNGQPVEFGDVIK